MKASRNAIGGACCMAIVLSATAAFARPPSELADLEGVRASSGESALQQRGYRNVGGSEEGGNKWTYWLNDKALNPCVGVITRDGRYADIQGFDAAKCKRHSGNAGAAVAGVAIAAILGAALLGHHDDHHKDGQHYTDHGREAEFERGYNDGMHDGQFVNYDHNQNYVDGYAAGQRERENRMSASRFHYSERNRPSTSLYRQNCAIEAARYWGLPVSSVQAYDASSTGNGMHDVTVTAGYRTGVCTADKNGDVKYIQNR